MKVYQEKQEMVNTGIEITNYEILQRLGVPAMINFIITPIKIPPITILDKTPIVVLLEYFL